MPGPGAKPDPTSQPRLRLDKWLWQARFFKGRDLAAEMVLAGHCRVNGQHCLKPGHALTPGDVLSFPHGRHIWVIRVLALGERRGPACEAERLYQDLSPASDLE